LKNRVPFLGRKGGFGRHATLLLSSAEMRDPIQCLIR
jgi:hypothetical protein